MNKRSYSNNTSKASSSSSSSSSLLPQNQCHHRVVTVTSNDDVKQQRIREEGLTSQSKGGITRLQSNDFGGGLRDSESHSVDDSNNPIKIYYDNSIDKHVNEFMTTLINKVNGSNIQHDVKPLVVKHALAAISIGIEKYCEEEKYSRQFALQQQQLLLQQQQQQQQQQYQLQKAFLVEDGVMKMPIPAPNVHIIPPPAPSLSLPSNHPSSSYNSKCSSILQSVKPRGPLHCNVTDADTLVEWTYNFLKNFDIKFIFFDHFHDIFITSKNTKIKIIREIFSKHKNGNLFKIYDKGRKLCLASRGIFLPPDNKLVYPIDIDCGISQMNENEYIDIIYKFLYDFQIKNGIRITILNKLFENRSHYYSGNATNTTTNYLFLKDIRFKCMGKKEICLSDYNNFVSNNNSNNSNSNNNNSNSNPMLFPQGTASGFMSGFNNIHSPPYTNPNTSGKTNNSNSNLNNGILNNTSTLNVSTSTNVTNITTNTNGNNNNNITSTSTNTSKIVNMSRLRRSKIPHIIEGREPLDLWVARNWSEVDAWIDYQQLLTRRQSMQYDSHNNNSNSNNDNNDNNSNNNNNNNNNEEYGKMYLGMDIEWKPNFVKGQVENPVSVIQLSTSTSTIVIQLIYMIEGYSKGSLRYIINCSEKFKEILKSQEIIKVGVGIKNDLLKVKNDLNIEIGAFDEIADINEKLSSLLFNIDSAQNDDIHDIYSIGYNSDSDKKTTIKTRSLQHYCKQYLNYNLSKTKRLVLSNWSNKELSNDQIIYAAYDALASKCIYDSIISNISKSSSSSEDQTHTQTVINSNSK